MPFLIIFFSYKMDFYGKEDLDLVILHSYTILNTLIRSRILFFEHFLAIIKQYVSPKHPISASSKNAFQKNTFQHIKIATQ